MKPVIFPLKLQMNRAEVGDLHQALSALGFTIAAAEKKNQRFGPSTRAAVRKFQLANKLSGTGAVDEATAKAINKELADNGALDLPPSSPPTQDPSPDNMYLVAGRVLRADGPPILGAEVHALHKNLRSEVSLAKQRVDDLGRYRISYTPPKGLKQADLIVRAIRPETDIELAKSEVICHAKRIEIVNLIVGGTEYHGYSEYERVSQAVQPHLDGATFNELTVADIALLECKVQQPPLNIAYLAIANRYAQRTQVPAGAYYGFFRMNLPTQLPKLVSQHIQVQRHALLDALEANIVPESLKDNINQILQQLKQTAVNLALNVPEGHQNISLAPLLSTTGLSAAQQGALLTRYSLYQGTIQEFWTALKTDPELGKPAVVEELQFALQLGTLTNSYVPLVQKLQERGKAMQVTTVQDLATLQHQDWLALVKQTGTPPGTPGKTELERAEHYSKKLGQTIEVAFPTAVIVAGLKRKNSPEQRDLLRFFSNNPDFTFETNVDRYLKEKSGTAVGRIAAVDQTANQLKTMQRVYNVAPQVGRFAAMTTLLDAGLDSAQAIVHQGQEVFVKSLSGLLGAEAIANEIYDTAVQTNAQALSVFGQYGMALSIGTPAVIRNHTAQGADIPNWQRLFGSLSFCECEHCRSVYSPAAYLVDLLQFVKQQLAIELSNGVVTYPVATNPDGTTRSKTALDVLFERRSDIGETQLSCQNTNTLLPYIDLANEVLENAVVLQAPAYQTTWTAEELSANPEHQNETAYALLAVPVYPRLLPFTLWLQEARTYLGHLGVSLVELMEVLHRPGQTGVALVALELQIAIESLGLSLVSARIITNTLQIARPLSAFWGWPIKPANWPDVLFNLPTFLERAEIEYETLEALRKTSFINADGQLTVKFVTPCNVEGATINHLTEPVLDKIHRFLRLQQATGWEIAELDAAMTAMQVTDLTPVFFVQVSQIQRIKSALNRPVLEMLSWWSNVSTVVDATDPEDRSLYDELFLNNTVLSPVDEAFQLNSTRSDLQNSGTAPLGEHKPTILAALAITEADFALILSDTGKTEADGLTLALLSELFRYTSLAKALGLAIADFLSLRKLTGIEPFKNPNTTLEFLAEVETVDQSRFSIATLDYLLRQVYTETGGLAPTESSIILVLDSIKTGLQAIAAENVLAADPTGEITRARLLLLLAGDDLQQAINIIEGTTVLTQTEQEAFIDEHFVTFLGDTTAAKALFTRPIDPDHAEQQKEARYEYLLQPLVAYLRTTLSTQLVVQTIADALSLETAVSEAVLTEYVTAPNDASKKAIDVLIGIDLESTTYTAADLDTYRLLYKIATVLTTLKVTATELVWVFEKGPALGWLELKRLPLAIPSDAQAAKLYAGWKRLIALYSFRDTYPVAGDVTVFSVLDLVDSGSDRDSVLSTLSSLTGWDLLNVDYLTGSDGFNLTYPDDYQAERYLVDLQAAVSLLTRLGVSAEAAKGWILSDDLGQMKTVAAAIKNTVKAKYDNDTWLTVAEPLKNQLREQQRSALVAHLVARRPDIEEASDLFEHYLIDVEMSSCMKTSRIKQAISSVQLFVQRCLMNLEPNVEISEVSAKQWEWMKNYRVWEANRKIFLYPENWIVPELRDDKSPFFKELENELLQNEITQETAETVLVGYLEKLDGVANLDVRALYHQNEAGDVPIDILHVFGRTYSMPYEHYYRTCVDSVSWNPWEKVPVDLQGDHLLAFIWNRRLYLFWFIISEVSLGSDSCGVLLDLLVTAFPELSESPELHLQEEFTQFFDDFEIQENLETILAADDIDLNTDLEETITSIEDALTALLWNDDVDVSTVEQIVKDWAACFVSDGRSQNIQLAWAEYQDGVWSEKRLAPALLTTPYRLTKSFVFKPQLSQAGTAGEELVITCYAVENASLMLTIGEFHVTGCNGRVVVTIFDVPTQSLPLQRPTQSGFDNMRFIEHPKVDVSLSVPFARTDPTGNLAFGAIDTVSVLGATPGRFVVAVPHQYNEFVSQDMFFYQDDTRSFLVKPRNTSPFTSGLQYTDAISFDHVLQTSSALYTALSAINATPAHGQPAIMQTLQDSTVDRGLTPRHAAAQERTLLPDIEIGFETTIDHLSGATALFSTHVYDLSNTYHPFVCTLMKTLNRDGVEGVMQRVVQQTKSEASWFTQTYQPVLGAVGEHPQEVIEFTDGAAYSLYNWELFFHAPLLIATRLSQNQRFEEAQRWLHYIFNPTARVDTAEVTGPERYWNFLPFYEENTQQTIDELMLALNAGDAELEAQVAAWRETPFNPHLIARMRPVAYMKTVVMKYLDNLIAWGDSLFRRDTIEAINEATQLYVLAANILGSRPQSLPADQVADSETYNSLSDKLDEFSNALVQIENQTPARKTPVFDPFDDLFPTPPIITLPPVFIPLPSVSTLYFCVPKNDQLCAYWDTVADRLFKIRNCMNIEGVVRQLALFEPPIDPALLVQATAAGIDISSVLSDLYAPRPHYRFQLMLQKAMEFCGDVRSLGAALLNALEKQDAEALALLRASQEVQLLQAAKQIREQQVKEAEETAASLEKSKALAEARLAYYASREYTNPNEKLQLTLMGASAILQGVAQLTELTASFIHGIPDAYAGGAGLYGSPLAFTHSGGGSKVAAGMQAASRSMNGLASIASTGSSLAATKSSFDRRAEEWVFQGELAAKEIDQIDKQIVAAQIRVAIAAQELANHNQQSEHAQAVHDFMKSKYTNDQLYSWMVSQISSIYFQSYQMAYDLAKRAEKAYQHELGVTTSSFISFGYWDSLKKGLMSSEKLQYDLRRMEMSYLDQNKREYEITKHVSLALLNPEALLRLTTEGECSFVIPEALFDLECPGHYLRRIKSIGVTIPCVAGPYTSINCTLTLTADKIRRETSTTAGYAYTGPEDTRFQCNYIAQSIATSSGQNDSGLFEVNFRDERYLPLEGAGAISDWNMKLTSAVPTFDWSTITDVVIHLRYTAREGGDLLRDAALKSLQSELEGIPLRRAFSVRHEFPTEWNAFLRPATDGQVVLKLDLSEKRFPFFARGLEPTISKLELIALVKSPSTWTPFDVTADGGGSSTTVTLISADSLYGGNPSGAVNYNDASPGVWTFTVGTSSLGPPSEWIDNLVIIATYQVTVPT